MNLRPEGSRYRKISLRDERSRRWAKMRREHADDAYPTPPGTAAAVVAEYLNTNEEQIELKWASIAALVVHFIVFLLVVPKSSLEAFTPDRAAAIIVKKFSPPAPPAKSKKTAKKKKTKPIPIPDPTPDDPEPVEPEESEIDLGEMSMEFVLGAPDGSPQVTGGARRDAFNAGEGGVMPPTIVRKIDPEYTPDATRRGIQGEVWIEAVVNIDGRVVEPKLLRGLPDDELNRRAMEAIQRWIFKPGMKDGRPVAVIAVFTVTYRLH